MCCAGWSSPEAAFAKLLLPTASCPVSARAPPPPPLLQCILPLHQPLSVGLPCVLPIAEAALTSSLLYSLGLSYNLELAFTLFLQAFSLA